VAQLEIQEMEQARMGLQDENKKLKAKCSEMESCLSVAHNDREKLVKHIEKVSKLVEKVKEDKENALKENDLLTIKCKQLKLEHEELRENQAKLITLQESAEEKAATLERRYEALKSHAESKLDSANVEIAKVRATYEKEIAALKTKYSRCEIQIQSLERTLAGKELENQELTKICDGLVQQMESLST
jgi:chromosome segregation ATPase